MKKFLIVLLIALVSGCASLDKSGPYSGNDIVYKADLVTGTAYEVLHSFVTFEYQNRATLQKSNPAVTKAADKVRAHAQQWIGTAVTLRQAYTANPTPAGRKDLETALAVLQAAITEAMGYLVQSPALSPSNQTP